MVVIPLCKLQMEGSLGSLPFAKISIIGESKSAGTWESSFSQWSCGQGMLFWS